MFRPFRQLATEVLVRAPAKKPHDSPEPVDKYAHCHWEYAAMSSIAYDKTRLKSRHGNHEDQMQTQTTPSLPGWSRWSDFPSHGLLEKLRSCGLYVDVWERENTPRAIAVVFEGTNFTELSDWRANLRWFSRFLPSYEDQYTVAADDVARELYERFGTTPARYQIKVGNPRLLSAKGDPIELVATGHSLGGGLAQHFAYAFQQPFASGGPKVSQVFAFNASPVTGWHVVPRGIRSYNACNLCINRIFEKGEFLTFFRLVTSCFSAYTKHPSFWEYRYNFNPFWNPIRNHSIGMLAKGLREAADRRSA